MRFFSALAFAAAFRARSLALRASSLRRSSSSACFLRSSSSMSGSEGGVGTSTSPNIVFAWLSRLKASARGSPSCLVKYSTGWFAPTSRPAPSRSQRCANAMFALDSSGSAACSRSIAWCVDNKWRDSGCIMSASRAVRLSTSWSTWWSITVVMVASLPSGTHCQRMNNAYATTRLRHDRHKTKRTFE